MSKRKKKKCGAPTKSCWKCGYRYPGGRLDIKKCPKCKTPRPCRNDKTMGNGRCRMHGGPARRGADHPNATNLRYSKYAPDKIVERYETMVNDPKMLTLREEIGLVRARISELLENVRDGESEETWKSLMTELQSMRKARDSENVKNMAKALNAMETLIERGSSAKESWDELGSHMDRLSRLITLERRHIIAMRYLMTAEDVAILFTQVIQILTIRMKNEDERRKVVGDLRGLLAQPDHPGA